MSNPWERELQAVVSCQKWILNTELGSLQEHHGLLTAETSLQPPCEHSYHDYDHDYEKWLSGINRSLALSKVYICDSHDLIYSHDKLLYPESL